MQHLSTVYLSLRRYSFNTSNRSDVFSYETNFALCPQRIFVAVSEPRRQLHVCTTSTDKFVTTWASQFCIDRMLSNRYTKNTYPDTFSVKLLNTKYYENPFRNFGDSIKVTNDTYDM
jgi:hypothetical protein